MSGFNVDFMSETLSAVVFDLDGTLVDSARDLTRSLNHVLQHAGFQEVSRDQVRHMVGHGARALLQKGLEQNGATPADAELDQLQDLFLAHYQTHMSDETIVFPGAREVLERLGAAGIRLAVCTNKAENLTRKLLRELDLSSHFSVVTGGDSFDYRKPDPRHILATLEGMAVPPQEALMVGDSANDIDAARAAGLPVIGVSFGYTPVPVGELNPDIVIDHYNEFFPALQHLFTMTGQRRLNDPVP